MRSERAYLTLRERSTGEVQWSLLPLAAPALPLDEAGGYVAAAYVVFLVLLVVYVAIMAAKLQRIERELRQLAGFAEQGRHRDAAEERRTSPDQAAAAGESERPSVSDSLATHGSEGGGIR